MKKLKAITSVALGVILGLISACSHNRPKPEAGKPANPNTNNVPPTTNTVPNKQEEMPVRRPILE